MKDLKSSHWKYLIAGHYHQPQLLDYNAIYTGTPVQNSFGDELKGKDGYNGFFVIDTDKRYDIQFVPIIAPRFITVSSADELGQYDSDYIKSNYFRIKSTAKDVEEIKDTLSDILGDDDQEVRLELEKTIQRSSVVRLECLSLLRKLYRFMLRNAVRIRNLLISMLLWGWRYCLKPW